ncbi:unnamed protein product [Periconia digitata]|uniref:Nudix hydrolase domain-containing protein n=1 Tax=Periconia digitata TaxID=1303443 RepID=A0A9W4XJ47_9PLEO|nr:unnamed protein product [Periconia digitata]
MKVALINKYILAGNNGSIGGICWSIHLVSGFIRATLDSTRQLKLLHNPIAAWIHSPVPRLALPLPAAISSLTVFHDSNQMHNGAVNNSENRNKRHDEYRSTRFGKITPRPIHPAWRLDERCCLPKLLKNIKDDRRRGVGGNIDSTQDATSPSTATTTDPATTSKSTLPKTASSTAMSSSSSRPSAPQSSPHPTFAQYAAENFVQGGGVAIFHLKSERVVICSAEDRKGRTYFFLPKGRRDTGESAGQGAEREGFEESGYRNRLLPLPTKHHQPQAHPRVSTPPLTAEPLWIQLMPVGHRNIQYLLYWYVAETIPPSLEESLHSHPTEAYKPPPPFPADLTLKERVAMEPDGYEPIHHEGTGVDEEEAEYKSYLVPIDEAVVKLGKHDVLADVVLRGWRAIQERYSMEEKAATGGQ